MKPKVCPHLKLEHTLSIERAIVCGAPERAEWISHFLENPRSLAKNREYHSYQGLYNGKPILVVSHGVGSSGCAICFQELADAGVKTIIRLGTAGGLTDDAEIADIAVPTAAIRLDGVSSQMVPLAFPAVADTRLAIRLFDLLSLKTTRIRTGINLTSDLFYPGPLGSDLELYSRLGTISVEMECSTLFIIAHLRKLRAAAVLVQDGNPLKWKDGDYDNSAERLKPSMELSVKAILEVLTT